MKIDLLIEKYLNGETSLEEEKTLRNFLLADDLEEKYKKFREEFKYYFYMRSVEMKDPGFESNLLKEIHRVDKRKKFLHPGKLTYILSGIAASLLILIGAYTLYHYLNKDTKSLNAGANITLEDPNAAYFQTKKALFAVSANLNKGTGKLGKLSSFSETIDQLNKLSALNKIENNLNRSTQ